MIPVLFEKTATTFDNLGIGKLIDAKSCKVTEERNGMYELEMEYPVNGRHYEKIEIGSIICATHDDEGDAQPFQVYDITKEIGGIITIKAEHISYRLNKIVVNPFYATEAGDAMYGMYIQQILDTGEQGFSFYTDKEMQAYFLLAHPETARSVLGGIDGSILDTYGGEYVWDEWTVYLKEKRGTDNGVTIKYGKNLTNYTQENDTQNVVTAIVAYAADSDGNIIYTGKIKSSHYDDFPYGKTVSIDFSSEFDEDNEPTVAKLTVLANEYLSKNKPWNIVESIDIEFVALWQTEEYKDTIKTQKIGLCDTITVIFEEYGVKQKMKIVKVIYNTLLERYESITVGEVKKGMSDTVVSQSEMDAFGADYIAYVNAALYRKMDKENAKGTGTFTINSRKTGSTVGTRSAVLGNNNEASGTDSIALGNGNTASGNDAIAIGHNATASGYGSTALSGSTASGSGAFSQGGQTKASGEYAVSFGKQGEASGHYSMTQGSGNIAKSHYAHAEGRGCIAGIENGQEDLLDGTGAGAHAEGDGTKALGNFSHSEGVLSKTYGKHSHAEGYGCETGSSTTSESAYGQGAHAEGEDTVAFGNYSHSEGKDTVAQSKYSHAEGIGTQTCIQGQSVCGQYNEAVASDNYLFIVGNGTSNTNRSNVFAVGSSGAILGTSLGMGGNSIYGLPTPSNDWDAATKAYVDGKVAGLYKYKGSVATQSALPLTADVGDVYNVIDSGMNYAWTGTEWDALGGTVSITAITNTEIDQICV